MRPVYHHQPKSVRAHISCDSTQRAIQNSQSKVTNMGCVCGFGLRAPNGAARWMPGYPGPTGPHLTPYRLITVAASIEECKPWFHDLRGETRVRLGRSLC